MQRYGASAYTILLDIFQPSKLIEQAEIERGENPTEYSQTALDYCYTLEKKGLINYTTDLISDPWCVQACNNKDIFTSLPQRERKNISGESKKHSLTNSVPEILRVDSETSLLVGEKLDKLHIEESEKESNSHESYLDYRFSAVEVIPVDMKRGQILSKSEPLRAKLLGYGVVRLYRDNESTKNESSLMKNEGDKTTVAMLGLPFYFTPSDLLLGFFDKDVMENTTHIRLIKTKTPNRYMVLMKFRSPESAQSFVDSYNGRHFNSLESETCQVIFIKEVLFRPHQIPDKALSTIPYLLDDPFTKMEIKKKPSTTKELITKKKVNPDSTYTELATCPVCLERLDSNISGLMTIPCEHTFHSKCLSKWDDDTCPVCRYSSKSDMRKSQLQRQDDQCAECHTTENLWICLICGHIGCGRYNKGHAIKHYNETSHCFVMEISTQRVWDYSGDNYVHRLVQSQVDGKFLELPDNPAHSSGATEGSSKNGGISMEAKQAKIEKLGLEYSNMLISQLDSQRDFYTMKVEEAENKLKLADSNIQTVRKSMKELEAKLESVTNEMKQLRANEGLKDEISSIKQKYNDETTMNSGLSAKIDFLTKENTELKKQKQDLEEQTKDLMFYLDSQEKFKNAPDAVKEGQIVMKPSKTSKRKKKKKTRSARRV